MAKRIVAYSKGGNWRRAFELCDTGRERNILDKLLARFYFTFQLLELFMKENPQEFQEFFKDEHPGNPDILSFYRETFKQLHKQQEVAITALFLDALRRFDGNKIIEIAEAVWIFKKAYKDNNQVDAERAKLIVLKEMLEQAERKWDIRTVASFVAGHPVTKTPADGFSALRRKCKQINFPLAPARKIKKK